jgi:hypothetical protein
MALSAVNGMQIVSSGFTMPGASGGLNKALTVNDMELDPHETITLAVNARVKQLNFPPVKDTDGYQRVHVLEVLGVAVVDEETVAGAIQAQALKVEQAAGVTRLPYPPDEDPATDTDDPGSD